MSSVLRTSGEALPAAVRTPMESRFGRDFRTVRVHRDEQAEASARAVGARAFTSAEHIVFGRGHYAPQTERGKVLLSHELAHVVQQRRALPGAAPSVAREALDDDEIHRELIADFRRRHGLEGEAARGGPSDAEIKYRLAPAEAAQKTAPPPASGGATGPTPAAPPAPSGTLSPCTTATGIRMVSTSPAALAAAPTAGGLCALMEVQPASATGCGVTESVTLGAGDCPATLFTSSICAGGATFTTGRNQNPSACGSITVSPSQFTDRHSARATVSVLHDATRNPAGLTRCTRSCDQVYFIPGAGAGGANRVLGRFRIDYAFARSTSGGSPITTVTVSKTQVP